MIDEYRERGEEFPIDRKQMETDDRDQMEANNGKPIIDSDGQSVESNG